MNLNREIKTIKIETNKSKIAAIYISPESVMFVLKKLYATITRKVSTIITIISHKNVVIKHCFILLFIINLQMITAIINIETDFIKWLV